MKNNKPNNPNSNPNIIFASAVTAVTAVCLIFLSIIFLPIHGLLYGETPNLFPQAFSQAFPQTEIVAQGAVVYNIESNKFVYEKDADTPRPMASMAKLVTAATVYEIIHSWPKNSITPITIVKKMPDSNAGDRGLIEGEKWMPDNLIRYMLISSSNIAADALQEYITKDREIFSILMNAYTRNRGFKNFQFRNPSGLSIKNPNPKNGQGAYLSSSIGTPKEIAMLYADIVKNNSFIREATSLERARFINSSGNEHDIVNTNILLSKIPNIIGGKTGFTDLAGGNLVIAVQEKSGTYIIVVMGSTVKDRFDDVVNLASSTTAYAAGR